MRDKLNACSVLQVARVLRFEDRVEPKPRHSVLPKPRHGGRSKTACDAQSTIASEVSKDMEQGPAIPELKIEPIEYHYQPFGVDGLLISVFVLLSVVLLLTRQVQSMFLQLVQAFQKNAQLENEVRYLKKAVEDAHQERVHKDDKAIKPHLVCKRTLLGGKKKSPSKHFSTVPD